MKQKSFVENNEGRIDGDRMSTQELTDDDLRAATKRASDRVKKERLDVCDRNKISATIIRAGIVSPKLVQASPKCSNPWCLYRMATDRERARGVCDECTAGELQKTRQRELLERIPRGFRGASLEVPSPSIPADKVAEAKAWLAGSGHLLTISARRERAGNGRRWIENPTAAGKTTLAGMVANSAIAMGKTIEWFDAADLDPVIDAKKAATTYERILACDFPIIDGYGKELAGAIPDSDIAIRRKGFSAKLPNKIHTCRKGQRFVVTLDITGELGIASYGAAEFRRIASPRNATIIVLSRNDALDVARL